MKFGVYLPTHNNPLFLRTALLQILVQSSVPDVLCYFENGHGASYGWAVGDILDLLRQRGVKVIAHHTPLKVTNPAFYEWPLSVLFEEEGCTLFVKLDQDDIIYRDHFRTMRSYLGNFDWAANKHCQLLVLPREGNYKYNPKVDFGTWNPTGAPTPTIIFNRKVAEKYLDLMKRNPGMADDVILANMLKSSLYRGYIHDAIDPTMCYVSHGKNLSTAHWADNPPPEAL